MKLIRQVVIALALLAIFISLSVFSTVEYTGEEADLNNKEDKLPLVKAALTKFDDFLSVINNIPILGLLPAAKVGADYETETVKNIYNKVEDVSKNNPNIKEEIPAQLVGIAAEELDNIDLVDLTTKVREILSKDWFRP